MCTKNIEERYAHRQWIITNLDTLRSSVVVSGRDLYDKVVAAIIEDLHLLTESRKNSGFWGRSCARLLNKNKQLEEQLAKAIEQDYCKICGNILDGYKPKDEKNKFKGE